MKIKTTDPDLETICNRIRSGFIDIKPDFQRGDVWTMTKKKLLIDSILRDWQVPPIHVIKNYENKLEVLDGQQRLRAIYDYINDEFPINGNIEPLNIEIEKLHGKRFSQLPQEIKSQLETYPIRVFEISEYESGEPGELFNRLNNALNLTTAEKRNAYVGKVTDQAKKLVSILSDVGLDREFLGFSNKRMAYDDLFIKLCYLHENDGIYTHISDQALSERVKNDKPFSERIIKSLEVAIEILGNINRNCIEHSINIHVTKATAFSWLFFISNLHITETRFDLQVIIDSFIALESSRYKLRSGEKITTSDFKNILDAGTVETILLLYNERASAKVMTVESICIRDFIITIFVGYIASSPLDTNHNDKLKSFDRLYSQKQINNIDLMKISTNLESY